MNILTMLINHQEYRARRETLHLLRGMSDRQLSDCGISRELIELGINAWPWKDPDITYEHTQPASHLIHAKLYPDNDITNSKATVPYSGIPSKTVDQRKRATGFAPADHTEKNAA